MTIYENGIELSKDELDRLRKSAANQGEKIEWLLKKGKGLTSFEIEDILKSHNLIPANTPQTSIRRALCNLANSQSGVCKTRSKREGRYGVQVHVYRWVGQAKQTSMFAEKSRNGIML